ncbi:Phospholipase_D-nuclease N-terminal [Geobacter sp. DSM 9736]|nr:Phospholipase_D-nuclease N-terminal [Geobacter sp. DSM 9736]
MHGFEIIGAVGIAMMFVFWLIFAAGFVVWLWALVDILRHEFSGNNKLIWLLVVISLPLLGVLLYWFIGREQKVSSDVHAPFSGHGEDNKEEER